MNQMRTVQFFVCALYALCGLLLSAGCVDTPQDTERDFWEAYGNVSGGGEDEGEQHRPGQPCLLCHSEFALAGTVFLNETDSAGVRGARVFVEDANGVISSTRTYSTGNFMFANAGGGGDDEDEDGTPLNAPLAFPYRTWVEYAGQTVEMEGLIQREGSCASCHSREPDFGDYRRITLEE